LGFVAGILTATLAQGWMAKTALAGAFLLGAFLPHAVVLCLPALLMWPLKFSLGSLGDEAVFLRLDHAACLGLALYLSGRARIAEAPGWPAALALLLIAEVGVLVGWMGGTLTAPTSSLLYLAQWAQLLFVFLAAYALAPRKKMWALYAWVVPWFAVAGFGLLEARWPAEGAGDVVYRSFERIFFAGQANHVGGLLAFGVVVGAALLGDARWRGLGVVMVVIGIAALQGTHSREGWIALGTGLLLLASLRYPRAVLLAGLLALVLMPFWLHAVPSFAERGGSLEDRWQHWHSAVRTVADYPLLGLGLAARHRSFYDNQYILWLVETGLAGLLVFLFWFAGLGRALWHAHRRAGIGGHLALGVLCGVSALAMQSMAAVVFLVTGLAGPALWLAGASLAVEDERA
jgi:O-antigen ligase